MRPRKNPAVSVTRSKIPVREVLESVNDQAAGATVLFLGTVRNPGAAGEVNGMTYEACGSMAERKLDETRGETFERWPVERTGIVHRVGKMELEDVSVAVAVSSAHRGDDLGVKVRD